MLRCRIYLQFLAPALLLAAAVHVDTAIAANIGVRGGTVFETLTYRDVRDFLRDSRRLTQFLRLRFLGSYSGLDVGCFAGMRLRTNFGLSRNEDRLISGLDRQSFEVLFGFVDIDAHGGTYGIGLGRRLDWKSGMLTAFDGFEAFLRLPFHLKVSGLAGFKARPGTWSWPDSFGSSLALQKDPAPYFGLDVSVHGFRRASVEVGWRRTFDGSLVQELVHGRSWFEPFDWLQASADAEVDAMLGQLYWLDARIEIEPVSGLNLTALYNISRPRFTSDSIFSVFDLHDRQDAGMGIRYMWSRKTWSDLNVIARSYLGETGANLIVRSGAGFFTPPLNLNLYLDAQWGPSGNTGMLDLQSRMETIPDILFVKFRAAALLYGGLTTVTLHEKQRSIAGFDSASFTTVLSLEFVLSDLGRLEAGMEATSDEFYDYLLRAVALLTLEFGS